MGERRKSREFVLQMLYSMDISKLSCDETLRLFWFSNPGESAEVRGFTERIVRGVVEKGTDANGLFFVTKGDNSLADDGKIRFEEIERVLIALVY